MKMFFMFGKRQLSLTKEELPRKMSYLDWELTKILTGKPAVLSLPKCPYEIETDDKTETVKIYYNP